MFRSKSNSMKTINYLLILSIAIASASCAGKKFDYQSAYKFKSPKSQHFDYQLNDLSAANSTDIISKGLILNDTEIDSNNEIKKATVESSPKVNSKREEILSQLSKKERKIFSRVEKKIERKLEAKPAASKSVNAKVYTGVIVGAAGLVLMILTSGTLGAIGGIALLVGLIFIVWGLLE